MSESLICGKCLAPDSYLAVELCPLHASVRKLLEALEAIVVRITEEGDYFYGQEFDVQEIAMKAINAAKEKL